MTFQLKRFGKAKNKTTTAELINFLNVDIRKYAKVTAYLTVILETDKEMDFEKMRDSLNTEDYPFIGVILFAKIKELYSFIEIWPNYGMEQFYMEEILKR